MYRFNKPVGVVIALLLFCSFSANLNSQDLKSAIRLSKSEQFAAAASMYKKLIAQNPADGDLYYYYGLSTMKKYYSDTLNVSFEEKADSAKAIFQLGIAKDPSNPLNFVGLGALRLIVKDIPGAKVEFDKAIALLPSKANKQLKMAPDRQAKTLTHMAEAYVIASVRDTAATFDYLRKAEKLDNKNTDHPQRNTGLGSA